MEISDETIKHLKPVFDACDQNGDGYVKTQDLLQLVQQYTDIGSEDIKSIIGFLDPNDHGSITFEHFCHGVKEFVVANGGHHDELSIENNNDIVMNDETELHEEVEADRISHSTTSTNDYNEDFEEDALTDDYGHNSSFQRNKIYSTYPPKGMKKKDQIAFPQRLGPPSVDENLSETSEYQSDCGYNGNPEIMEDISNGPLSSTPTLRRKSAMVRSRNKYVSHSLNVSPNRSYEDLGKAISDNDVNISSLSDQIFRLTSEVSSLQQDHSINQGKHNRMKQENKHLSERINALEELLESQKVSTEETVQEESRKYSAALTRLERESEEKLERLQNKLNEANAEINQLKQVDPMLRRELEQSIQEKQKLEEKIESLEYILSDKESLIEVLEEKLRLQKDTFEEERVHHTKEVVELQTHIDELKNFKKEAESRLPDFVNVAAEKGDLEDQLRILQKENADLINSRDELRVQLIQQGKCLLEKKTSLADELLTADKEDVLKALRDQENLNHRLRCYTDSILMMIMEYHPELLEK